MLGQQIYTAPGVHGDLLDRAMREAGTRLFPSSHTVEWHLRKVVIKLGVTAAFGVHARRQGASRTQLRPPDAGTDGRPG